MNRFEEHAGPVVDEEPLRRDGRSKRPGGPPGVALLWILTAGASVQLLADGLNMSTGNFSPVFTTILAFGSTVVLVFGVVGLIRYYTRGRR